MTMANYIKEIENIRNVKIINYPEISAYLENKNDTAKELLEIIKIISKEYSVEIEHDQDPEEDTEQIIIYLVLKKFTVKDMKYIEKLEKKIKSRDILITDTYKN